MASRNSKKPESICICNCIPEEEIRQAIRDGARTLADIQNETFATVGPCGGSCKPRVLAILEDELARLGLTDSSGAPAAESPPASGPGHEPTGSDD